MKLEIPDFDGFSHMPFAYGGKSCRKEILVLDGEEWMIKFRTKNLPDQKTARNLSFYTNSVISEWLGSHVYEAIGIPVQETRLGCLDGKLVVACRHIHAIYERLQELLALAKVLNDEWFEYFSSGGRLTDIEKVTDMIRNEALLSGINLSDHFWDMFVVDAFIGNTDRHPGNIGIIRGSDGSLRCFPVYDNESSFNAKLPERTIQNLVSK